MKPHPHRTWRYDLALGLLVLALVGLAARLASLIHHQQAQAAVLAQRQQKMYMPLPGRPGNVYARTQSRYVLLAGSKQVPSCCVDPFILADGEIGDVAISLGGALGMDPLEIQDIIIQRRQREFAWVKRRLSDAQANAVRALRLPGVRIEHEWQREYANGSLASSVVGFRLSDGAGGGGIELSQHEPLSPTDGMRVTLCDVARRPFLAVPQESYPPTDGNHVFLTIDAVVQSYLEDAVRRTVEKHGGKWGVGVVMDPQTGEVLAMCSFPDFDPNEYRTARAEDRAPRAVTSPYEPGSAAKSVYAAAAVEAGVVNWQTKLFCENGTYHASRGGRITDHGSSYGYLTVEEGLIHSSNILMSKTGELLGNAQLYAISEQWGFNKRSGIELPGESAGILRPLNRWDGYSLRRVPFGQEISVTAVQLATAFCAFANGGLLMQPRLVSHISDADGRIVYQSQPTVVRRVLSAGVAGEAVRVMQQVVERGTGTRAASKRYTIWGKTGTAQIAGQGGYVPNAYTGTFVGGAPATNPRVVCLISIYWPERSKGYYGGTIAAPYVREVLDQTLTYMNVPPDRAGNQSPPGDGGRGGW